jgi:hypothetical protein
VPADEAIAADLASRHGERALLVEAREGGDGQVRMLAVLDVAPETIAAETARLGARDGGPAVELIDRATWLAIERLQASGLLQRVEGPVRVLHSAAGA